MNIIRLLLIVNAILFALVYGRSKDTLTAEDYPVDIDTLPSACNDLEDGYHWIRPLVDSDDEYPNIYVYCHNGYVIINPSLFDFFNYHHVKSLFTTYSEYVLIASIILELYWHKSVLIQFFFTKIRKSHCIYI